MGAETKEQKAQLRELMLTKFKEFSEKEISEFVKKIEENLFDFANFREAQVVLVYTAGYGQVPIESIIKKCYENDKIMVLPVFTEKPNDIKLLKVDDFENSLIQEEDGIFKPDTAKCKPVPAERIDIALIPGLAFDEKNSRLGFGNGTYNKIIPKLSNTTRKVSLGFEFQIIQNIPMESHDRYVDIVITDQRIIYKI